MRYVFNHSESRAQRIFVCFQPLLFIAVVLFFPIAYPLSVLLENIKSRLHSQQTCEKIDVDCEVKCVILSFGSYIVFDIRT